ncbi:MAG TPA: M14 family zinc carboxypeptidase, partial [Thermoanaerobaculia bacterium]|nr:M14 family zinc carboxypeptidase [Thermoanaerobaculia bacterium]
MNDGRGGPDERANLVFPYEYHRKNCRVNNPEGNDPEQGDCVQPGRPNVGLSQFGTDPNRNYGGFWGGPGASAGGPAPFGDYAQDYRGDGPFSEVETRNVRRLVSARQVTTLITNHTYSNLLLRPPGIRAQGPPPDEPVYKALGDAMASKNGYASQPSYMLYDTTGGTEDWTYYSTGGLGFTFEIGSTNFHPPYAQTIAEYEGTSTAAANRGGNREAYFVAMESTANKARHSRLNGTAPPGAVLRVRKQFKTATSPVLNEDGEEGAKILFDDALSTVFDVPDSGRIDWGVNPSTRPLVGEGEGRPTTGSPSPPIVRENQLASQPPCPTYFPPGNPETCVAGGYTDEKFVVPANGGGVDNGFFTARIDFPEDADMDLEVYKANAAGNATGEPLGSSASSNNPELTKIGPDPEPGNYVARVINFSGGTTYDLRISFQSPEPFVPPRTESWTLSCETGGGRVLASRQIVVGRGETGDASFGRVCAAATNTAPSSRCVSSRAKVRRKSVGRAVLGRNRARQRRRFGNARRLKSRKGIDRYCVKTGGTMRIGYPTRRLNAGRSAQSRKRTRRKAVLAISTAPKLRLRRLRVGSSTRTLRRRLKGERRVRVGKNVWYTAEGRSSRLLFRTRGRRVRELGLGNKRLTNTRRGTVRFLRAWDRRGL